jgi:disulfide bond formation protein DsbB
MNSEAAIKSLSLGRIAVGLCAWLAPSLFGRALRLEHTDNAYVARLFGARDAALGIGTLTAHGEARRSWLLAGIACDAADAAAAALGGRAGSLSTPGATLLAAPAVLATVVGAAALGSGMRGQRSAA